MTYGDNRFADLLRDVEALDEPCQLSTFASEDVKELAHRFFLVWQQLKNLYMPKARPTSREKSMMENLLQLDLLLDQHRLASGRPMPDDLVVSTVLRCVDVNVRKHLELTMDDSLDYQQLKERLIIMDKNARVWSGDTCLKMVQNSMATSSSSGPVPMEVDQ